MTATVAAERPLYANYWADDTVANPTIVQLLHRKPKDDHYSVRLPNGGGERQVHIHTLGRPYHG